MPAPGEMGWQLRGRCWGLDGVQQMGPLRLMTEEEVLDYLWTGSDSQIKRCARNRTPTLHICARPQGTFVPFPVRLWPSSKLRGEAEANDARVRVWKQQGGQKKGW